MYVNEEMGFTTIQLLPITTTPLFPVTPYLKINRLTRRIIFFPAKVIPRAKSDIADLQITHNSNKNNTTTTNNKKFSEKNSNGDNEVAQVVEIPVTCYQIIGVSDRAEKDEIVKSVMNLKNAEVEEGYTTETIVSRQTLLMDVRDKLLFEPEYAGNIREKIPPKASLRVPWAWLPGALCLLQEAGEEKLVLDIGRAALQRPDANPYIHDILLSMALAECTIATAGFEKNRISQGFEALARAQCLLRSKVSLGKMNLLTQIEESLEKLAPACTLELLGLPQTPENAERRLGAIAALRELLRQGLDVEAFCQVEDWPCFLSQALDKLMATEIVSILSWDNVAVTRKNKKSFESQNQRTVIDFDCFYKALAAHIAFGFSSKQTLMIDKAKIISECLISSEGIDLKFEEAFCLFLLGQVEESEAVERLQQLQSDSGSASPISSSGTNVKNVSKKNHLLETWLKNNVLDLFLDTRECSPSLAEFFKGEKKVFDSRQIRGPPQTMSSQSTRQLSFGSDLKSSEKPLSYTNSLHHLGSAAKQLAPSNLQAPLIAGKTDNETNNNMSSVQLKRNLGSRNRSIWNEKPEIRNLLGKITAAVALGCILLAAFRLSASNIRRIRSSPLVGAGSYSWSTNSSLGKRMGSEYVRENSIYGKLKRVMSVLSLRLRRHPDVTNLQNSFPTASLSSSMTAICKNAMDMEEAESLVRQWQTIKAEALGPGHQVDSLAQLLEGPMLVQWQALADSAKARSCFWRFVLLQLSVVRAEISSDGFGTEIGEIEALLEEAAELVDESQSKNPNYCSTYRIRYILKRHGDDSWRFCEGAILSP